MKIIPEPVSFDWDKGNIDKNFKKHGVRDREAEEPFFNKRRYVFEDERHSLTEKRYMVWGVTDKRRRLSVFFTFRKNKVRIISARDMNKKEREKYEKI